MNDLMRNNNMKHERFVEDCEILERSWLQELEPAEYDKLMRGPSENLTQFLRQKYTENGLAHLLKKN